MTNQKPLWMRPRTQTLLWALLLAYFVFVCATLFWPVPVDSEGETHKVVVRVVHYTQSHEQLRWADYDFFEGSANIALFMPLGFLAVLLVVRAKRLLLVSTLIALAGSLFSFAAETLQLVLLPSRVFSWFDLLHNAIGMVLGCAIGYLIGRRLIRRFS